MIQQNDQKILMILILLLFLVLIGVFALAVYLQKNDLLPYSSKEILRCYDKNNTYVGRFEDTYEGEAFFSNEVQTRYFLINNKTVEMDCYYEKYLIKS